MTFFIIYMIIKTYSRNNDRIMHPCMESLTFISLGNDYESFFLNSDYKMIYSEITKNHQSENTKKTSHKSESCNLRKYSISSSLGLRAIIGLPSLFHCFCPLYYLFFDWVAMENGIE